jgi:hypothetical protein
MSQVLSLLRAVFATHNDFAPGGDVIADVLSDVHQEEIPPA